jgi:hypothetical protein
VDESDAVSRPVVGFGISDAELSGISNDTSPYETEVFQLTVYM